MRNKLYFMNDGVADIRALMTFGVNVKEKEGAFGFFGTGFKYAVAIVARLGGTVTVKTKPKDGIVETVYEFTKRTETVRGEDFDFICMNGELTEFTTRLGVNWEPWQAFREFYCNCIDEKNSIVSQELEGRETIIEVDCYEIVKAFRDKSKYFLDTEKLDEQAGICVHKGPSSYYYYHGVAVHQLDNPSKFAYNFTGAHVSLSEDRVALNTDSMHRQVGIALMLLESEDIVFDVLSIRDSYHESSIPYPTYSDCSQTFLKVANKLFSTDRGVSQSVRAIVRHHTKKEEEFTPRELTPLQTMMMIKAKGFLQKIDIDIDGSGYEVLSVKGMGEGVCGAALDGKIYISELPFNAGTKEVAATLLEEYVHIKTGCYDFDRTMQNWLFGKVLSLAEVIAGEPI